MLDWNSKSGWWFLIGCALSSLGIWAFVGPSLDAAQLGKSPVVKSARIEKLDKDKLPAFSDSREAAALQFARAHHPELAGLLEHLRAQQAEQYQKAIRELFRVSEILAELKERDPRKHDLDLKHWQVESRIQLLVAQLSMGPSPTLEAELRSALELQRELKMDRMELDRERLQVKLQALEAQLAKTRDEGPEQLDRRMQQLLRPFRSVPGAARSGGAASSVTTPTTTIGPQQGPSVSPRESSRAAKAIP